MPHPEPGSPTAECLRATICDFILPFFLPSVAGNTEIARAAVMALIDAHSPSTITELDLVGRIISFGIVALDNLRLSMTKDMPDAKVLRYRSNAVALSRAADQSRQILQRLQLEQEAPHKIPRPAIAPAPKPVDRAPAPPHPGHAHASALANPAMPNPSHQELEAMQQEARRMIAAFSKQRVMTSAAVQTAPDPAMMARSAARAAFTAASQLEQMPPPSGLTR